MEVFSVLASMSLVDMITGPLKAISAQMKLTGRSAESLGVRAGKLAKRLAPLAIVAAIFLATLAPCVGVAADFEASMSKVGAVSGATSAELSLLTEAARELGATTEWSAMQVAEGEQYLAMAGFSVRENIEALPAVLNLASAGATDLGRAADIASDIMSAFGLQAKDMTRVSDVLAATFTTANTNLEMLGDTMRYVGPVAAKAGMDLESTAAMAGLLANVGIKSSQGGTVLRTMIASLVNPAGVAQKAMASLKIETLDVAGNLRNPITLLGEMAGAMQDLGSGEQLQILSKVFGREAMSGVAELMGKEGLGGITKYTNSIRANSGAAALIAAKQNDNFAGAVKSLNSAFESLMITIGQLFLPVMRSLAESTTSFVRWLDQIAQHPVGSVILQIAAGAAVLMIGLTVLTAAVWAGTAAWGIFNVVMLANPIGLIVLAIVAAIAGFIALYSYCDGFRELVDSLWEGLKGLGSTLYDFFSILSNVGVVGVFAYYFTDAWNSLNQFWDSLKSLFDIDLSEAGKKLLLTLAEGIMSVAMAPFNAVKGVLSKVRDLLPFSDAREGPLSSLTLSGQKILETLGTGITSAAPSLQMTASAALEGVAVAADMPGPADPLNKSESKASSITNVQRKGSSVVIQSLTVNLPGVANAEGFIAALQGLVMEHDPVGA